MKQKEHKLRPIINSILANRKVYSAVSGLLKIVYFTFFWKSKKE